MRPSLPLLAVAGAAFLAAWSFQGPDDAEQQCRADRLDLYYDAVDDNTEGADERHRIIERADSLLAVWDERAPQCTGRLREIRAYVLVEGKRFEQIATEVRAYLDGSGRRAESRSKILLGQYLALALNELGRTRDATRAYYEAASYADDTEAHFGASALIDAASSARVMGDERTSMAYLRAAFRLIDDSLATNERLLAAKGHALVSFALLTEMQLETATSQTERTALTRRLERTTDEALTILGRQRKEAGLRSLATNLNALALAMLGRHEEAEARLEPSLDLAREAGFRLPAAVYDMYLQMGRIRELRGDVDAAREAFQMARAEARRLQSDDGAGRYEAIALEELGGLAEHEGQWAEAADYYYAAIERHEAFRDRLGLEDWSATALARMQIPYRGLVRTRLAQGRTDDAFALLDLTRARYLRDLRAHLAVRRQLTPDTRARVDSIADELARARALVAEPISSAEEAALREQMSQLQGEIERITGAPRPDNEPLRLDRLQRVLDATDRTLISYFVDEEASYAFVVRPDTLAAVPLDLEPIEVREALRQTGGPWAGGLSDPAFDLTALHRLHELLVAPIATLVPTERVVIVPDIEVATVPFAMLTTSPAESFETAPYLLHEWAISTELTAGLVAEEGPRPEVPISVLAFGRGTFEPDGSTWNSADLPHVEREVEQVTGYKGGVAYLGDDATEERFAELADEAHVIHLASHAEANSTLPLHSRIALSGDGDHDGTLHLYEVLEMPLVADLVVLSGCSTADGGRNDGEGVIGLQYGMRAAGAAATLATLWPVADDATTELMAAFYEGLAEGLDKDEALRQAQQTYLASHEGIEASPFFWAAPVLSGSAAPVPLRRPSRWPWALLGLASLGGLAWAFRKRRTHA